MGHRAPHAKARHRYFRARPQQDLRGAAHELIGELLKCGPLAQEAAKSLIRAVSGHPRDEALLDETARRIAEQRASVEGREGLAAFLEKRRPAWTG